ncbi:uncharacterized protein Z518_00539 [Rhinocladiella mackenziei CBS 650.93]|uniref:Uncharacterized protein n=1 Tax=Rhinocladiella mackenziei CBS 650.93 TaxID=1442369 RepID=A0A0D2ITN9_9EURO|nr:uncharacterized protein Z518_00539 [Rhinocladiella mackenziei CBS 650.93]KIX09459.1 hypothetical protein Z518_00539 [Rhinocladiella mackenziei CBS 650.93]
MTAILPQGLINTTTTVERYAFDDSDIHLTNGEFLRRFWKGLVELVPFGRHLRMADSNGSVYAIQSDATRDHASTRARNLFWRVWSSPSLTQSMTTVRLVRLWQRCSHDLDLTPIGDHHPNLSHAAFPQPSLATRQARNRSSSVSPASGIPPTSDSSPRTGQNVVPSLQDFRLPPAPDETPGARLPRRSTPSGREQSDNNSRSPSHTPSESSSRPSLSRTASGGPARLPVSATSGKSRTRPQIPRRKSSTQRSPVAPNAPKSPRGHSGTSRSGSASRDTGDTGTGRLNPHDLPPGLPNLPSTASGTVFALPSASSWQSVDSSTENPALTTTAPALPSGELVDRDFRGKFVETQKKLASSSNLAGLGRMKKTGSVVRFADEIPQELRKGKEKETRPPLQDENTRPLRSRPTVVSDVVSDDSSSDEMELPRTKSQLSLLIKHKRDETGSRDLGREETTPDPKGKGKAKAKAKAKSKEEELLSMARRDGVTKAGGVQVPKQQRLSEQDDPGSLSRSSSEPLF